MTGMTRDSAVVQLAKYALVGVSNSLVTLVTIFVCKSALGVNPYVSNAIGYVLGLVNSFVWNKLWVFHSHRRAHVEAAKFLGGFAVCYGLQLLTVWALVQLTPLGGFLARIGTVAVSGYGVATIIGMAVYTVLNFLFNRLVTFRAASSGRGSV